MNGAAMAPDRIPDGADPRAARALLLPGLASAAADERAVFRHMGAAPVGRVRVDHRLPDHRAVHAPAEDLIAELERPDLFVVRVHDIDFHKFSVHSFQFSVCSH